MTQRRGRRWTAGTGALHVEIYDAVLEPAEGNITAVIGDGWADPRLDQFFDRSNGFGILRFEKLIAICRCSGLDAAYDRSARHEMLHYGAENPGLELLPFAGALRDRDEIGAEKHAGYSRDLEQTFSYCLLDTPIPMFNYVAHVRLLPVTDGDRTFWHWESRFTTRPEDTEGITQMVAEQIYQAGFDAIRRHLQEAA